MATAAFGIIKHNRTILLVKIAEPFRDAHKWNFPGGVIEHGEKVKEGLIREIFEESHIVAEIHSRIDTFRTSDPENTIHVYEGAYLSGELAIQESEIEAAGWFTVDDALDLPLAFNVRDYISKLQ